MKDTEKTAGVNAPMERLPKITLKRRTADRERAAHPWIFSNEIAEPKLMSRLQAGDLVEVLDCHGHYLGTGFVNPKSLIAIRILGRDRKEVIDADFFARRFEGAIFQREMIYGRETAEKSTYRAVFGESDSLPGLIIDRFGSVWVMQFHAAGLWLKRDVLLAALRKVVTDVEGEEAIACVVARTDVQSHALEGLERGSEIIFGSLPKAGVFAFEGGLRYPVDPVGGQKTGFYFDQRENRRVFGELVRRRKQAGQECRVADLYCHAGAWGLAALAAGADHATFVDSSQAALDTVATVLRERGWEKRAQLVCGDVKEELGKMRKERFDLISLDPPSFIPNRKAVAQGMKAYAALNGAASALLNPGGILATSSCSHNCEEARFLEITSTALRAKGLDPKLLYRGGPAFDHPPRPGMPESEYLKSFFYAV